MSIQRCCPPAKVHKADFTASADLLRALADPHRLTILATLARSSGEVCVCDFTNGLPLNQPAVSHHLKVLRDAGIVTGRRHGTWVYYSLAPDARERIARTLDASLPQERGKK